MRYGAMDGSLGRPPLSLDAVVRAARDAGLDGVEPCLRGDYARDAIWTEEGARATRAAARGRGIELPSLTLLMLNQGGFTGDESTCRRAREIVAHSVDLATWLGAATILLPFFGAGEIDGPEAKVRVGDDLRALAPGAEAAGVVLAIETTLPAHDMVTMVRAIASSAVSIYYDVSNAVWLGYDPIAELATLHAAGMLPQIHIKDGKVRTGDAAPGEGRAPYPAVAAALPGTRLRVGVRRLPRLRDDADRRPGRGRASTCGLHARAPRRVTVAVRRARVGREPTWCKETE